MIYCEDNKSYSSTGLPKEKQMCKKMKETSVTSLICLRACKQL